MIGAILALGYTLFFRSLGRDRRLDRDGATATGRLTRVQGVTSAHGFRTTMVHYAFEVADPQGGASRTYTGRGPLAVGIVHHPKEGSPVEVIYLRDAPSISKLRGNAGQRGIWIMVLVMLTGLFFTVFGQLF